RSAIVRNDDHVLRRIHQFAGEITGVSSLQRRIRETLPRAVSGNEILKDAQAFAEIRCNRALDDFAAWLGHQTAHTGKLAHLLAVTARAGINHQVDWVILLPILVLLQFAEHHVGNLIAPVRPDIDDLVVTLAVGNDAATVLLVHLLDLLISVVQLGLFAFWNDHVLDPNRDTGASRFLKPELFELIQRGDCDCRTGDLIAAPNDVAELFLARRLIKEAKFFWPNLIENDTASGRLDHGGIRISKAGLPSAIRILKQNSVMRFDRAFDHCE